MNLKTKLEIVHDDGGVLTNYSDDAYDFKRDPFTVTMTTDDYIYVGYHKVINAVYVSMITPNTVSNKLTVEYFGDSGWSVLDVCEDTKGFTRDGFINWERPSDAVASTIDSSELCWIRMSTDTDSSAIEMQAINIVFSDDNLLCQEVPALIDQCFYPANQTSHIMTHVSAKNYIMGRLRNLGYVKYDANGEQNINEWDILDINELTQASTYYTISQIYFNLSDDPEDQYWAKYREYDKKFEEAFGLGRLRIDLDDDGQVDAVEKRPINTIRWNR